MKLIIALLSTLALCSIALADDAANMNNSNNIKKEDTMKHDEKPMAGDMHEEKDMHAGKMEHKHSKEMHAKGAHGKKMKTMKTESKSETKTE